MHHIRPYRIFTLLETPPFERIVNVPLPSRRGVGGTSILETFLILAVAKIVNARRIFEFGTFLGSNTLSLALNTPEDARIFTLDLDEKNAAKATQLSGDAPLTQLHLEHQSSLDFAGTSVAAKVSTLLGNSTTFDFIELKDSIDFLFIDGGHDYSTVKSDTENALEMASKRTPSSIMWHDYRNAEYPDLTRYLDDLAEEREIFHVEDTTLCVWFNDLNGTTLSQLVS